jgi:hypothetical protein
MQDLFRNMLGGGPQQQQYQDFVNRYQQGHPSEGYSGQEVMQRYQEVAANCSPEVYQESAEQAFARMTPQERQQFAQFLQQRAQQQNVPMVDYNRDGIDDRMQQDPRELAQMTTRMEQQQPGILGQLLGGVMGGPQPRSPGGTGNQGGVGAMLENPVAKAALAGIAAMAVKNMMERRAA